MFRNPFKKGKNIFNMAVKQKPDRASWLVKSYIRILSMQRLEEFVLHYEVDC